MERRQRPVVNGSWDRPRYGNDSLQRPPGFRREAPHYPPSRTGPQHPDYEAPRTGAWESRSHYDAEQRPQHEQGGPPHGYPGPPRPELFPPGGTRLGVPHHVHPGQTQCDLSRPSPNTPNDGLVPPAVVQYTAPHDITLPGRPLHTSDLYQSGYNVQHGGPQHPSDQRQEPLYSEGPPPSNNLFLQRCPSGFRGPDPTVYPYAGIQHQDDGQAPQGVYHLNAIPGPDTYNYRVLSPGIQQYSTQSTPTQSTPQQSGYLVPPVQGNLLNPSYALHSPIGSTASVSHKEEGLRHSSHPHHLLNHQERRKGLDPLITPGVTGSQPYDHEVPDLHRDPHLTQQHGTPFVSHPNPHIEDRNMHIDRQNDMEKCRPEDKDFFVQWLSSFLSRRRQKPPTKPDAVQTPSIGEARGLIYGALRLVSQLDSLCQVLESRNKAGEPWTQEYAKAADIQADLEKRLKELEKPGYIQAVKRKLDAVHKKRLRWQRRRQAEEEEKNATVELCAEKEASIDLWRMKCIQKVEEKKRERELKATADHVLGEVRKKQNDVRKMLDVLKSLEKLRKLRKEAAGRKGVCPPPSADDTFTNHVKRLRTMVHKRSALYDAEEKTLRVILEGEQEEERQREKDKRLKKEKEKTLQKQRKLDSILFGDTEPLPSLHPLLPFRQYYLQAEHSVVSLVQIRHEWDQFLVPPHHSDGSSIPCGWVMPTPPSSDTWATALKQSD